MPATSKTVPMIADIKATPDEFTSEHIERAVALAAEKLPPRRVALVDAYIANGFNGSAAYRSAGYKVSDPNIANTESAKILSNHLVSDYLHWRLRQVTVQEGCEIDEGKLIRESNALAYSSLTDVITWDAGGNITLRPSSEIPREASVAIKKIKTTRRLIPNGDGEPTEEVRVEVEMHDKKGALDLQAKIAGMMRGKDGSKPDNAPFILNMYIGTQPEEEVSPPVAG
jgi:hypothetical protein